MIDTNIDFTSSTPLHLQITNRIYEAINTGKLAAKAPLPSVRVLSSSFSVSKVTVERAYNQLLKDGHLERIIGKGFFVKLKEELKILLVFNKINSFKRSIYYSFIKTIGNDVHVDLRIHDYNPVKLKNILVESRGKYDFYVVMPHFSINSDEGFCIKTLSLIPQEKLVLLDRELKGFDREHISVCQDFKNDIYDSFKDNCSLFDKYTKINFVEELNSYTSQDVLGGVERFAKEEYKQFSVVGSLLNYELRKGEVYLVMSDNELASALKKASALKLNPGKDIGIISFNESKLKELLNVTVVTTDWEEMGTLAANLIKSGVSAKVKNRFVLIQRGSL